VAESELVRCAGAIVFDTSGRLLLVRRGHEPSRDLWCEPSGRCEPGESASDACVREAREETGLDVRVVRPAGSVRIGRYVIDDFVCEVVGGRERAGDDAAELRWVTRAELAQLPLVADLEAILAAWNCLPRL
jgi:8-oxo-dGTP diphosphatase